MKKGSIFVTLFLIPLFLFSMEILTPPLELSANDGNEEIELSSTDRTAAYNLPGDLAEVNLEEEENEEEGGEEEESLDNDFSLPLPPDSFLYIGTVSAQNRADTVPQTPPTFFSLRAPPLFS